MTADPSSTAPSATPTVVALAPSVSPGSLGTVAGAAVLFMLVCGLLYPAVTVGVAQLLFPRQAEGSLIVRGGEVVGSELVGQPFGDAGYFIGRPSAAGYDPTSVAGSNLASSNPALRARAEGSAAEIAAREGVAPDHIPVDLIAASGSGIDPHVSPDGALLQVPRVAAARGLDEAEVQALVARFTERGPLGLGQPGVNVLELNLALDALDGRRAPARP